MRASIIFLARDRTTAWEHANAGLSGVDGIQPIEDYDVAAVIPMHNTSDYNLLLAELKPIYMESNAAGLPRHMVPGDLVVFDTGGHVFLADVPNKWTLLDTVTGAPFVALANRNPETGA